MSLWPYVASLLATKNDNDDVIVSHCVISILSISDNIAIAKAREECLKSYPENDGWENHSVKVIQYAPNWIVHTKDISEQIT